MNEIRANQISKLHEQRLF